MSEELISYKVDLARDSLMTSVGGGSVRGVGERINTTSTTLRTTSSALSRLRFGRYCRTS
jgi:hypothetical protein